MAGIALNYAHKDRTGQEDHAMMKIIPSRPGRHEDDEAYMAEAIARLAREARRDHDADVAVAMRQAARSFGLRPNSEVQ
jgi:hypothetical protein